MFDPPIPPDVSSSPLNSTFETWFAIATIICFSGLGFFYLAVLWVAFKERREREQRIRDAEAKLERTPDKAHYAWDVARIKLEAYFDRNLSQVKAIFWAAVGAMVAGFLLTVYGVGIAIQSPKQLATSIVGVGAGIITEFISATLMVIYRSTMQQATSFMTVLERINSVGMAVQILDSIPESEGVLRNETRAELVKILLATSASSKGDMTTSTASSKRQQRSSVFEAFRS